MKQTRRGAQRTVRVPADYCWLVLDRLLRSLSVLVPPALVSELTEIIRSRDVQRYSALGDRFGLQSMTEVKEFGGEFCLASQLLLVSVIKKHPTMETCSASERKRKCLESVKTLDISLPKESIYWRADRVFQRLKIELQNILGEVPTTEVIAESARHGPGSSTTLGYKDRSAYFKYADWPYPVAPRAADLLIAVIKLDQRWVGVLEDDYRRRYQIPPWRLLNQEVFWRNIVHDEHCWNRVTTVPKDGSKDRPIAIEPAGNIFLQLGIEGVIRARLLAAGLNLNTQELNRQWCLRSSKDDRGYTIDLSNASDTISRNFCENVLPAGWFELLDRVRSPWGEFPDGTYWRYAKMSSMGNATTFVLESLLFWGLQRAVSFEFGHRHDRSIAFGDDLEGPSYLSNHMLVYLPICGFTVNRSKSFLKGPVRESCGVDAVLGHDIRPVFLKTQPTTECDVLNDRNRLNRWFGQHHGTGNPMELDVFFSKYLGDLWDGPESDTEFDTYWHSSDFPFVGFRSYTRSVSERPAKGFGFRKLMHNLRGGSEGNRFLVPKGEVGKIRLINRSPLVGGYSVGGVLMDHPKQPFGL